jgi:hypothetical protein
MKKILIVFLVLLAGCDMEKVQVRMKCIEKSQPVYHPHHGIEYNTLFLYEPKGRVYEKEGVGYRTCEVGKYYNIEIFKTEQ